MLKAKDIMTKNVITISPDATLADVAELLDAKKITGVPVVDGEGKVIGVITEKDILNFAFQFVTNLHATRVKEAMTVKVVSFTSDTDIDKISECFTKSLFRRVPIIDDGKLVGILSRRDIIRSLL
ncbi:MAG: CBS domain-containing protein [Elusimicrobia bacterium]|nr:CBS domain-containing protein [Candidatus Liberimonas magnetica]